MTPRLTATPFLNPCFQISSRPRHIFSFITQRDPYISNLVSSALRAPTLVLNASTGLVDVLKLFL